MKNYYLDYKMRIEKVIGKFSKRPALRYLRNSGSIERMTFEKFGKFLKSAENELKKTGLIQGDRAVILSPQSPFSVFMGITLAYYGITVVPVDSSLPPEEFNKLIVFSDVRAVFTTSEMYGNLCADITDNIPCYHIDSKLAFIPFVENSTKKYNLKITPDPETDVIAVIYSSGTTGQMKGVKITYESVLKSRKVTLRLSGIREYMSYLFILPFNHIAGFASVMTCFLTGIEMDFIEDVNSVKLEKGLKAFQPHFFIIVPKVYEVMEQKIRTAIRQKGRIVNSTITGLMKFSGFMRKQYGLKIGKIIFRPVLKEAFGENIFGLASGASPCKAETAEFFLNLGIEFENFYASTETNVTVSATGIYDRYSVNSVGNVNRHPEIKIKINNPDKNGIGEITVKSELIMKGYFRQPELTEKAFENGWFRTGDYGYIDEKGYLYITGRIKESIVLQNGKKVSPSDIDEYYLSKTDKYDIASRGIVNPEGQYDEIHLFIADNGYDESERNKAISLFQKESRKAPAMYKLSGIHFVPQIQRTSVGKVKRFSLSIQDKATDIENTDRNYEKNLNIFEFVCSSIKQLEGLDNDFIITDDMRLKEDIGMDSLNIFELCVNLDEKYNISLEACLHDEMTVNEIIEAVRNGNSIDEPISDASEYPLKKTGKDCRAFEIFTGLSRLIWDFHIYGRQNIHHGEQYIFCPNHECHFDGMWIIGSLDESIRNNICSIAADYLFNKKIYRRGVIFMGGIPTHRDGNTATAMKRAFECISSEGYNLLIHPEGTRTKNGQLGKFKEGAARLSIDSGIKIIPVCINGAYEIFPRFRSIPRFFDWKHLRKYPVQIQFGVPINPQNKTEDEITKEIKKQISDMKKNLKERII